MNGQMKRRTEQPDRQRVVRRKKRKINWKKVQRILTVLLLIAALVGIALSPLMNISKIEVTGNNHYSKQEIGNASGIKLGENGFRQIGGSLMGFFCLRNTASEKRILMGRTYLKKALVQYRLPGTVQIRLEERVPAFSIQSDEKIILLDKEYFILEVLQGEARNDLISIQGLKPWQVQPGQAIQVENQKALAEVTELLGAMGSIDSGAAAGQKLLPQLNSINFIDPNRIELLMDHRVRVRFGDLKELPYKMSFFRQVFFANLKKEDKGVLDFSNGKNPSFMPDP